jgi:hypothetical protein
LVCAAEVKRSKNIMVYTKFTFATNERDTGFNVELIGIRAKSTF